MARPTILVLDDDPQVLGAVATDLERRYGGHDRVLRAESGAVALDLPAKPNLWNEPVALHPATL